MICNMSKSSDSPDKNHYQSFVLLQKIVHKSVYSIYSLYWNKIRINKVTWNTFLTDYKAEIQMTTFYVPNYTGEIFILGNKFLIIKFYIEFDSQLCLKCTY